MDRTARRLAFLIPIILLPMGAGCVFVPMPVDVHAGPGRSLRIADAETREPIPGATVLVERYRIEGAMHAAPVVVLHTIERVPLGPDGGYELARRVHWQTMWLVWMPEVRHGPVREVVAVKVFAPGHEAVWFAVKGPLDDLNVVAAAPGSDTPVLCLRPLRTAAECEAAAVLIARHGWPPGPTQTTADVVVPPDVRAQLVPIMVRRYETLLAAFPDYEHAPRIRLVLDRWRKALPK